jgi:hypothetical protein
LITCYVKHLKLVLARWKKRLRNNKRKFFKKGKGKDFNKRFKKDAKERDPYNKSDSDIIGVGVNDFGNVSFKELAYRYFINISAFKHSTSRLDHFI